MTTLKDRLQQDLTTAIKSRDELRAATLRLALTAVKTEEVAGTASRELSDDEVVRVLIREAKKRREAAAAFEGAGRQDRAERELAEGAVLDEYLPAQLSDAELERLVAAAIKEADATEPRQMGQVMRILTPKLAGRAEGGRAAAEVRRHLGG